MPLAEKSATACPWNKTRLDTFGKKHSKILKNNPGRLFGAAPDYF